MLFVANGYDIHRFENQASSSPAAGNESDIQSQTPVRTEFVTLARWAAQKDYPNLFKAIGILANRGVEDFHCTLAGTDIDENNIKLMSFLNEYKIRNYVTLLGPISTVPLLLQQSDYLILPSVSGEAFPNVVAEAMLSGTPCIVTDVGDAADMVQSTGWVAEPRNPEALAEKILEAKELKQRGELHLLKIQCRDRAIAEFPVEKMVIGYESVWSSVAKKLPLSTGIS